MKRPMSPLIHICMAGCNNSAVEIEVIRPCRGLYEIYMADCYVYVSNTRLIKKAPPLILTMCLHLQTDFQYETEESFMNIL